MLAACSQPPTPVDLAPREVPTAIATPPDDAFYGVVTSTDSQVVTAEVDGAVRKLLVRPGQAVQKGATIAILDDAMIGKQIEEARGAEDSARGLVLQAQGQAAEAGRVYAQLVSLLRDGAVARDTVRSAGAAANVAGASVKVAQGSLARAIAGREQLEALRGHATITAPIDGIVAFVKVSEGQLAGRGQPIARVSNPAGLKLRFAVPREARDRLAVGAKVSVTIKGQAALRATVSEVGRTLEPPLQFAVIEADLDALPVDHASLLGALAEVRI